MYFPRGGGLVKVFYVKDCKLGVGSGDDAVEETFGGFQACALSCGDTREIEGFLEAIDSSSQQTRSRPCPSELFSVRQKRQHRRQSCPTCIMLKLC